jgi:DNA-binding MarR family transcriptional regulator
LSKNWTLISHHGHALLALANDPERTIDELAQVLGVTSRSVVNVINDLEAEGYLIKSRDGRRNRYAINLDAQLRHETSAGHTVRDLLAALGRIDGK